MVKSLIAPEILDYLLNGDPSVVWQTRQYLLYDDDEDDIHHYRLRVELEGWGKEILEAQDPNGLWASSLMMNKFESTLWAMIALKRLGIYPLDDFAVSCQRLVDNMHFTGGIIKEGTDEVHVCISGLIMSVLSYFRFQDPNREALFEYLIEHQNDNGSWTCEYHDHEHELVNTFNTTLAVLEGLLAFQSINPKYEALINDLQKEAHEFLLDHELFKKAEDEIISMDFLKYPFPYYHYDILTVLDYLRATGIEYDPRMEAAIDLLLETQIDLKWQMHDLPEGSEIVTFQDDDDEFSRFNTMRALRVLDQWESNIDSIVI